MTRDNIVSFERMTCPPILQHCEKCGKVIAQYTLLQDMKDGDDIYGWLKWHQAVHNYNEHKKFYHRLFWPIFEELYNNLGP